MPFLMFGQLCQCTEEVIAWLILKRLFRHTSVMCTMPRDWLDRYGPLTLYACLFQGHAPRQPSKRSVWWLLMCGIETCTGTEITPIPTRPRRLCFYPHTLSLPSPPVPAQLQFHPHPMHFHQYLFHPRPRTYSRQQVEHKFWCHERN